MAAPSHFPIGHAPPYPPQLLPPTSLGNWGQVGWGPSPCPDLGRPQAVTRTVALGPGSAASGRSGPSPSPAFWGPGPKFPAAASGPVRCSFSRPPPRRPPRGHTSFSGGLPFLEPWTSGGGCTVGAPGGRTGRGPEFSLVLAAPAASALGSFLSPPPPLTRGVGEGRGRGLPWAAGAPRSVPTHADPPGDV